MVVVAPLLHTCYVLLYIWPSVTGMHCRRVLRYCSTTNIHKSDQWHWMKVLFQLYA